MSIEVEAVRQVTDELVEACRRLLPQLSSAASALDADQLARIVDHQANTLLVARDQGAIVGMLTLVTFPLPSGLRARIEDVVVDQEARGHGVGTALTMAAIDLARRQDARNVDLTSRARGRPPTASTSGSASSSATPTSTGISPGRDPGGA